jgi:cytochrome c biogenesis protein CcmG/thiol:disulfide interchange protein DsbE
VKRVLTPLPIAVGLIVLALVALLAYGVNSNEPSRGLDQAVQAGKLPAAPAFKLPDLNGTGNSSLADYEGKVVLLNVWASWCSPCRAESPLLQRWHKRMVRGNGTVLGIDTLDVKGDALDFIKRFKLTYPQLHDRDGDAIRKFGVIAYPESFLIDRQGRVAATRRGPVDDAFMRKHVEPLLSS